MATNDGVTVWDREPRRRRGQRPTPRPLDALDSHVALIDALNSPDGAGIIESATAGETGFRETDTKRVNDKRFARELGDRLNTATTLVVTDRMLDFVLDRMGSIPFGDPLRPDDLLFEAAYIVLPRPVMIGDLTDDDYGDVFPPRKIASFDAGFYIPMGVATYDALREAEVTADGVMYVQAASIALAERILADLVVPGGSVRARRERQALDRQPRVDRSDAGGTASARRGGHERDGADLRDEVEACAGLLVGHRLWRVVGS